MQGWKILIAYFDKQNNSSLQLLQDTSRLQLLLQDHNLILFLRYLELIDKIDIDSLFKTLLLTARLLKIYPQKITGIIPFDDQLLIRVKEWVKCLPYEGQLLQKIAIYVIFLMRNGKLQEQLGVLSTNLLSVYHIMEYKNEGIAKYAKIYYSFAEQALLSLWNTLSKNFIRFQSLEKQQFTHFYCQYSLFCKYLRKIPKVKNIDLKNIEITEETNRKIQHKYRYISNSDQNYQKFEKQQVTLETRFVKMQKLVNQFEWQDF